MRRELEGRDKEIQDKATEIKALHREKVEQERARHTDIIKLRLEVGNVISIFTVVFTYTCNICPYFTSGFPPMCIRENI